jgi:2-dehydro-3-deoxyglucarate aldolase/4-hydroxy-2-oxoheptanedioate aldolase
MENKTKAKLKRGEIALGHFVLEFATPGIGHMIANAGCDFAIFDMEHTSFSHEQMRQAILSAKSAGITPIVRASDTEYFLMSRPLDAGAEGIMVPRVETKEQTEKIIESIKYPPLGVRGSAFGIAHDNYKGGDIGVATRKANEETLIIVQTETAKSVENVNQILSVKGIDVAWIGQADMTVSLGIPGQYDHPKFLKALDTIINTCAKYNVAPGFIPITLQETKMMIDKGIKCIAYTADVFLYSYFLKDGISQIKEYIEEKPEKFGQKKEDKSDTVGKTRVIDLGGGRKYKLTW